MISIGNNNLLGEFIKFQAEQLPVLSFAAQFSFPKLLPDQSLWEKYCAYKRWLAAPYLATPGPPKSEQVPLKVMAFQPTPKLTLPTK